MTTRKTDAENIKNLYETIDEQNLSDEEKYKYLTQNDSDILEHKARVLKIIGERGLGALMNDTKWLRLQKVISKLEYPPAYLEKRVTDTEFIYSDVDTDTISFIGDWSPYYMEGMPLFFDIEYLIIIPRRKEYLGTLVKAMTVDISEQLKDILIKNKIPFEMDHANFVIFGYK
ncbi:DUF6678 family protein [Formosa undariae]|uniref:DUF6678 family protein n=1 Tax=Formosa undariae TaxID=1325436 RepID=A0ABV5EY85_9FLAO